MTIKKSDQVEDDDSWSTLPTLLLWMIKSKFDYSNGVRFASVCKNWPDAYVSYPVHSFEVNNYPPWIMSCKEKKNKHHLFDSKREFVSLLTEESCTIDNPNFIGSEVLYSRQGWLLMAKMKPREPGSMEADVDTRFKSPYFLLNPFKNTSIKLPFLDVEFRNGGFTIQDGNPHCIIVLADNQGYYESQSIVLHLTHPGDNTWLHYRYDYKIPDLPGRLKVRWTFIIGNLVYFISEKGLVFVFNIKKLRWKELIGEHSDVRSFDEQYMVEREGGELLRVHFPQGVKKSISKANCHKLKINGENAHWELMQMDGHGNILGGQTCFWFLSLGGQSFVFETNKVDDLDRLQKAFRKRNNRTKNKGINTLTLCRSTNSWWLHMD